MVEGTGGYAHPGLLAETGWLAENLEDPGVRIIDCDVYDAYRRVHIPNALGLRGFPDAVSRQTPIPGHYIKDPNDPTYVMLPDQFAHLIGALGVSNDTLVVAYDSFGGLYAARLWWVLGYYGHSKVRVLNGGFNKWFAEGRPVTQEVPSIPRATFLPRTNPDLVCSLEYAKACVGKPDVVFLDVRSEEEWTGANPRDNRRSGHIPGAVHLEWLDFVTDDRLRAFKPAEEIGRMLQAAGVTPEKEVITY